MPYHLSPPDRLVLVFALTLVCAGARLDAVPSPPGFDLGRDLDRRLESGDRATQNPPRPAPGQRSRAEAILRNRLPELQLERHAIHGSPKWIAAGSGFLTGPGGEGRAMSGAAVPRRNWAPEDRHRVVKAFVDEHVGVFGHDALALERARIRRDYVAAHNQLRTTVWQQQVDGLDIVEAVFLAHVTKDGELVNVASQFLAEPDRAARAGHPHRAAGILEPTLSAARALNRASLHLGDEETVRGEPVARGEPEGEARRQKFQGPAFKGEAVAELCWLPLSEEKMRLCWGVWLVSRRQKAMFNVVLDAETGEVVLRRCLTRDATSATYRVFTEESPTSMLPGYTTTGSDNQPGTASRQLVTLAALNLTASPNGWIDDGVNETRGNNVDAHSDADGDDVADLPRPQGSPSRVFDFPLTLTLEPGHYRNGAIVQLFYWCNWLHDLLYDLGFTEPAGNFQNDNFGRGGEGDDAFLAEAQDADGYNNANVSLLPDGGAPRMQLFLYNKPSPDRDSSLDGTTVTHEYIHGLTYRRVGGGVGISAAQTWGLAEGWSDFYSLAFFCQPEDDPDGVYPVGAYVARDWSNYGRTYEHSGDNYYFGLRWYPYSTDLSRNPWTFVDIDPSQHEPHYGVPFNPGWMGYIGEVHQVGEVWGMMLWECYAEMVKKHGFASGRQLMLQLVTDGMALGPVNPTFVQARNAILVADLVLTGGSNQAELWRAFSKRGLGMNAVAPPSTTTTGVVEDFGTFSQLRVDAPQTEFYGPQGGPFQEAFTTYTLRNEGNVALDWSALLDPPLEASPSLGTLQPGATREITVSLDAHAASFFPPGSYALQILFSNNTDHVVFSRTATLKVRDTEVLLAGFYFDGNFNLELKRLTFTPDGAHGYWMCLDTVENLQSTAWATHLTLPEDGWVNVPLAGGKQVSLFGQTYSAVNIHENGHLTFTAQPATDACNDRATHFDTPRISGVYAELETTTNSQITYLQLESRFIVTWKNLLGENEHLNNTFQIELFFDGRIRITFLEVNESRLAAGLSSGHGRPLGFEDSHRITQVGTCAIPTLLLPVPQPGVEGGNPVPAQLRIPIAVESNLVVSLSSSDTTEARVPESVTILAGQTNAAFDIQVMDDRARDGSQLVYITAYAPNIYPGATHFRVDDNEPVTLTVTLPQVAEEGATNISGRVFMNDSASGVVGVTLESSTNQLIVPPVVFIPAGQTSVTFKAVSPQDNKIEGYRAEGVWARVPNWTPDFDYVLIRDDETTDMTLTVPPFVFEGTYTLSNQFKVTLSGTLETNLPVSLWSSNAATISPLTPAIIAAGTNKAYFNVVVGDNAEVDPGRWIRLVATAPGFSTALTDVLIYDNDVPPQPANPYPPDGATHWMLHTHLAWEPAEGELIVNGDFETGDLTGWVPGGYGGGGFVINDGTFNPDSPDGPLPPLEGSFSALAVQFGNGRHTLAQDFHIPDGATSVTLSWRQQTRNHAGQFSDHQRFAVELRRAEDDTLLATLSSTEPNDAAFSGPTNRTADLMPWRGQRVRLVFVEEDNLGHVNVHLDQVSVIAGSAAPTTFDVYLGLDSVPDETEYLGSTTNAFYQPLPLAGGLHYYWRIVARRGSVTNAGPVWEFTTSGSSASYAPLAFNSTWRYLATGTNLGTAWHAPFYDDSRWPADRAPLGFGGNETTTIGDATNEYVTFYFRRRVTLEDTNRLAVVTAFLKRDDGAVVYVNGREAFRDNMPNGRVDYLTQAASIAVGEEETNAVAHGIAPWLFLEGDNTLAVEVHQRHTESPVPRPSPDLFFDLAISMRTNVGNLAPRAVEWTTLADFDVVRAPTNLYLGAVMRDDDLVGARVQFFADGILLDTDLMIPFGVHWSNAPCGLHTLLAVARDGEGLSVASAPLHVVVAPGAAGASFITLVAPGDLWRYRENGYDPGSSWTTLDYREPTDQSWKSGPSQLGYGDGDEATVLDIQPDDYSKPITAYFRRAFTNELAVSAATLRVLRDDGVVVYLNGREVFRDNLPAGPIDSNTLAIVSLSPTEERVWLSQVLSPEFLGPGANLVAAEVHQRGSTSPDLSFDLELTASGQVLPSVAWIAPRHKSLWVAPASLMLRATASDPYGAVTQVRFFRRGDAWPLATVTSPPYEFAWRNPPAGVHTLTAAATDSDGNTSSSAAVSVTVLAPVVLGVEQCRNHITLWWPDTASDYGLEVTQDLTPPAWWKIVAEGVVQTNGQFRFPVDPLAPQQFFRLRRVP